MKILLYLSLLCAATLTASAQRVAIDARTNERVIVVEGWWGDPDIIPFDDYFGDDAEAMDAVYRVAEANAMHDGFRWEAKLQGIGAGTNNSCWDAANNIITDVDRFDMMHDGYEIRMIGTLGTKTNAMNRVANRAEQVYWSGKNKEWREVRGHDPLDPESYGHSLSVVRTPDGEYYTIDNWMGGIKMKQIYPIDDEAFYFSDNPDDTDLNKAGYRIHRTDGRPWEDPEKKRKEEESEEDKPSPIPPTSEPTETEVLTSADPNDKLGVRGAGAEQYITPEGLMRYIIRFENMPDASAPAQEVLVRDTLDLRVLDLSTFTLGDFTYGDQRVRVPSGLSAYSTRVPLDDGRLELLISAALVPQTGIVTWRFTTLDPETEDLPFDPLDGFLPPNRTAPEGEGSIAFTVALRENLAHGTRIRNEARIYFDLNEPIDTPPWTNTLDLTAPSSRVTEIARTTAADTLFTVHWDGDDEGSGIRSYDVYRAVNDGPFLLWHTNTSGVEARFAGQPDSTYAFFSIAYDAVGNAEPMKTEADVVTVVSARQTLADLPSTYRLDQNYPNPFNPRTTIRYAVPQPGHVSIRVYDMLGREVARIVDTDHQPGWYDTSVNASNLASGVYFYRMSAGTFTETRRMVVVR